MPGFARLSRRQHPLQRGVAALIIPYGLVGYMNPAFNIPLSDAQLQTLGELTAILGQLEYYMGECIAALLHVLRPTARSILGSTKSESTTEIWLSIVNGKCKHQDLKDLAACVARDLKELHKGRNDFVHAFFACKPTDSPART